MYYRYEALNKDGEYEGIFSVFNPDHCRYFNRFLKEPGHTKPLLVRL